MAKHKKMMVGARSVGAPSVGTPAVGATAPAPAPAYQLPAGVSPIATPTFKPPKSTSPTDMMSALAGYQDQANNANNQRYEQGLGQYTMAQALSQGIGQTAMNRIGQQEQQGYASSTQNAINRGLYNTTVLDAMQTGVRRNANDARQSIDEQTAQRGMGLHKDIAQFIANRNDTGPDVGMYANLMQAAAAGNQGNPPAKQTATISAGGNPNFGQSAPSAGGGASSSGSYNSSGDYYTMGGGGGGGAAGGGAAGYYANGGGGTMSGAYAGGGSGGPSQVMTDAGYKPGSISISGGSPVTSLGGSPTAGGAAPAQDPNNVAPSAGGSAPIQSMSYEQWKAGPGKDWSGWINEMSGLSQRQYQAYLAQIGAGGSISI